MSEPRQRKNFPKPQPEPLCTSSEKFSTGDRAGNPSLVWLQTLSAFPEPSISCLNVRRGKTPLNHNPNHCVHHQPPEKFSTGDRGNPSLAWLLSSCVPVCVLCARLNLETLQTLLAFPEPSISCMNVGSGKTPLNHNPNHCIHHQPPEKFSTGDRGNPSLAWLF